MDATPDSLGLLSLESDVGLSTGWNSAEAVQGALGLGRVLGGGLALESDTALGAHGAVVVDVAL